jgi:hypothetical protein
MINPEDKRFKPDGKTRRPEKAYPSGRVFQPNHYRDETQGSLSGIRFPGGKVSVHPANFGEAAGGGKH